MLPSKSKHRAKGIDEIRAYRAAWIIWVAVVLCFLVSALQWWRLLAG